MRRSTAHEAKRPSPRRAAGVLEQEVLAALWAADGPQSPSDVHASFGGDLAYTTIFTILGRLLEKGLVARERSSRGHRYRPAKGEAQLAAEQMRALLSRGPGEAVLQHFVSGLSPDEEALLRRIVGDKSE